MLKTSKILTSFLSLLIAFTFIFNIQANAAYLETDKTNPNVNVLVNAQNVINEYRAAKRIRAHRNDKSLSGFNITCYKDYYDYYDENSSYYIIRLEIAPLPNPGYHYQAEQLIVGTAPTNGAAIAFMSAIDLNDLIYTGDYKLNDKTTLWNIYSNLDMMYRAGFDTYTYANFFQEQLTMYCNQKLNGDYSKIEYLFKPNTHLGIEEDGLRAA